MADFFTKQRVVLGASNSSLTSDPYYTGDFWQLSVSWQTSTTSASRLTLLGTNDDGMAVALPAVVGSGTSGAWSLVTALTQSGIYSVTPGLRFVAALRDPISVSASSNVTVTIFGRT